MANNQACFPVSAGPDGPVLNQITKIRLADGREVAIVDWTWRPLFSVVNTLSGWVDQELRAFVYSEGDQVTSSNNFVARETATLKQTNISSPAEMDALEELLVYSINVEVYQLTDTQGVLSDAGIGQPIPLPNNIGRVQRCVIGELEISQKAYQQASIGWFAPGFGVSGFGNDAAGARTFAQSGTPSREAVDMFPVPTHIGGTEKYAFIFHNPQGTAITYRDEAGVAVVDAVLQFRCNLHGLHKRPSG